LLLFTDTADRDRYLAKANEGPKKIKLAMVLNGNSLEMAIQHHPDKFLALFARCETIICNRATPSQKAYVVALVTSRFKGITMAIGDGANDVSMIRKAHVGIGLIGREGRQAAQSADFVLHRFSHLRRLLFVHGRYSYQRSARVIVFRNVLLCSLFSGSLCIVYACTSKFVLGRFFVTF
jgi:magnesium-transporting ATPase (P-type)